MQRRIHLRFGASVAGALLLIASASTVRAAAPEVRGTWLTTTGPDHIRSGLNTAEVIADLRDIGLNTIYGETWKNGYSNFPSTRLVSVTGGADRSPFLGSTRDLVQETLIHAHRNQMAYIGWFEYGLAAQFIGAGGEPTNPLARYMRDRGWLLQNQSGQYGDSTNGFAWMNPAVPEVRRLLIDLTLEAVNRYDLDGIQFDDRLSWPAQFGFDTTTLNMYAQETGAPTPSSAANVQFSAWRQAKVTQFANELYGAVKTARPDLLVSVAPSITSFSTTNYNADWPSWQEQGLFDEFAVQAYRDNLSSFNSIVDAQIAPFEPDDLDQLVLGIRINGSGASTPAPDVLAMIERSRAEGAAGHSLWYSAGVRDLYASQLTDFYDVANDGHGYNPMFASDHRPPPIVAQRQVSGSDVWTIELPAAGRYRIVSRAAALWTEIATVELDAGVHHLSLPNASEVELLVDRRSSTSFLGDFDLDGSVDGTDLLVWQRGLGSSNAEVALGDANRDGKVNAADLLSWQLNFGYQVATPLASSSVPESIGSIHAIAIIGIIACRRVTRRKRVLIRWS